MAPEAIELDHAALETFEKAFSSRISSARSTCDCGREFYDTYNTGYDWEPGELDRLARDPKATGVPYAVGSLEFEGRTFVYDCDCWKQRAMRIIGFLRGHDREIAEFLSAEKKRKQAEADRSPVIE